MLISQARSAIKMLAPYTDRCETVALDGGGVAVTAYWTDGGQMLFYSAGAVSERVAEIQIRALDLEARR